MSNKSNLVIDISANTRIINNVNQDTPENKYVLYADTVLLRHHNQRLVM